MFTRRHDATGQPLKDVPAFAAFVDGAAPRRRAAARAAAVAPGRRAHEIDFKIIGSEMQFVEVELDPGESAVAEAGSMMYMTPRHPDGDHLRRRQPAAVGAA